MLKEVFDGEIMGWIGGEGVEILERGVETFAAALETVKKTIFGTAIIGDEKQNKLSSAEKSTIGEQNKLSSAEKSLRKGSQVRTMEDQGLSSAEKSLTQLLRVRLPNLEHLLRVVRELLENIPRNTHALDEQRQRLAEFDRREGTFDSDRSLFKFPSRKGLGRSQQESADGPAASTMVRRPVRQGHHARPAVRTSSVTGRRGGGIAQVVEGFSPPASDYGARQRSPTPAARTAEKRLKPRAAILDQLRQEAVAEAAADAGRAADRRRGIFFAAARGASRTRAGSVGPGSLRSQRSVGPGARLVRTQQHDHEPTVGFSADDSSSAPSVDVVGGSSAPNKCAPLPKQRRRLVFNDYLLPTEQLLLKLETLNTALDAKLLEILFQLYAESADRFFSSTLEAARRLLKLADAAVAEVGLTKPCLASDPRLLAARDRVYAGAYPRFLVRQMLAPGAAMEKVVRAAFSFGFPEQEDLAYAELRDRSYADLLAKHSAELRDRSYAIGYIQFEKDFSSYWEETVVVGAADRGGQHQHQHPFKPLMVDLRRVGPLAAQSLSEGLLAEFGRVRGGLLAAVGKVEELRVGVLEKMAALGRGRGGGNRGEEEVAKIVVSWDGNGLAYPHRTGFRPVSDTGFIRPVPHVGFAESMSQCHFGCTIHVIVSSCPMHSHVGCTALTEIHESSLKVVRCW